MKNPPAPRQRWPNNSLVCPESHRLLTGNSQVLVMVLRSGSRRPLQLGDRLCRITGSGAALPNLRKSNATPPNHSTQCTLSSLSRTVKSPNDDHGSGRCSSLPRPGFAYPDAFKILFLLRIILLFNVLAAPACQNSPQVGMTGDHQINP